ncbi:tail adaptor [Caudoviricetes sp.]|nr:tail adaptor [Caudoviricetes sp.]
MAYSGTVGQTVVSVQKFIDQGARMAGKLAEELTVEQVQGSKQALFFILSNLINQGVNYWCISKKVYGLKPDQYEYLLPLGGNDVLNALYRTINRPSGAVTASSGTAANATDGNVNTIDTQTSPDGYIEINYGTDNPIYAGSIGILPGVSGSFHILLETSTDGVTWNLLEDTGVTTWVDNEWLWYDIDPGANVQYYRMRETGGNTLAVREFFVGNNTTEVTMARLNRDDYTNLPNKNFTANQPYQYWFNRTIPQAKITLWPAPSDPFVQMTIWYSRQVMDVGDLYGELEIPQYFFQAIQCMLAHQMSLILPGVDLARVQYLEGQADKYFTMAENENRDKSPIYYAPNISVYTR